MVMALLFKSVLCVMRDLLVREMVVVSFDVSSYVCIRSCCGDGCISLGMGDLIGRSAHGGFCAWLVVVLIRW